MVRNKQVVCPVCYREMRSDVLKRHMKQHSMRNESVPATNILVTNNPSTVSTSDPRKRLNEESESNTEELRKQLTMLGNEYQRKLTLGKDIYKMIGEGIAPYQALPNDMKDALDTYMEHQEDFADVGNVELKPWQNELMKYIEPHDREIIWVVGKDGNEGKNWFQKYVKSVYGSRKVVSGINIKNNSANIFQALRKCSIVTVDIFLCNVGKSKYKFDPINYDALESIKDGEALAFKYDSQHLKIRVPNVVMVFSNSPPDVKELAKVRFRVFNINNNQLENVETKYPKEKKENVDSDSDVDSEISHEYDL